MLDLARAITGVQADNLRLTIVGGDTPTAPLGQSMRAMLELMLAGDPRVAFADAVAPDRVAALFDAHDLVVMPSLWECWPAVGMEALARNRPLLATPTGGFTEIVEEGSSGWLTEAPGAEPLARALEDLAAAPEQVAELRRSGKPRARFERAQRPRRGPGRLRGARRRHAAPPRRRRAGRQRRRRWSRS